MNTENSLTLKKEYVGIGKRKRSIARVFLIPGNGKLIINNVSGEQYFQDNMNYLDMVWLPLEKLKIDKNYDIISFVNGGGLIAQSQAIQLGVCRLLLQINNSYRKILKKFGFLTRDARIKERKKYGLRKARKAPQYSKR